MSEEPKEVPFEALGKAKRTDVAAVWNATPNASIRKVVGIMEKRGWQVSVSTVQRWHRDGFKEPDPGKNPKKAVDAAAKANRKAKDAVTKLTDLAPTHNNPALTEAIGFTESKVGDLVLLSHDELRDRLNTLTMAVSIVALEQFAIKAHALVLMPKDSGAFLASMAEVSAAIGPPGEPKPGDGKKDQKVIEGQTVPTEVQPTALSSKIAQFRKEQGLAVVK